MEKATWAQVLSWRTRRQFVDPPAGGGPVEVARRLAGVQAQVTSAAELLATEPGESVRLLGAFDAYVLGGGTNAVELVPAARRAEVSRPGGSSTSLVIPSVVYV